MIHCMPNSNNFSFNWLFVVEGIDDDEHNQCPSGNMRSERDAMMSHVAPIDIDIDGRRLDLPFEPLGGVGEHIFAV